MLFDVSGQVQRVFPGLALRKLGVPGLEGLDDVHVIDDGAACPVG